jgi:hypothetical protein
MQWFPGVYIHRFNHRHKEFGHLFSGRYKALPVEGSGTGYLKGAGDYVHLKPVRAACCGRRSRCRSIAGAVILTRNSTSSGGAPCLWQDLGAGQAEGAGAPGLSASFTQPRPSRTWRRRTVGMRLVNRGWVRISCGAWRRVCSPSKGIPSFIRSPWTSCGGRWSCDSPSRFSMRRREIASSFILSFIAPRTRRSGARDSGSQGDEAPNFSVERLVAGGSGSPPASGKLITEFRGTPKVFRSLSPRLRGTSYPGSAERLDGQL